MRSIIRCAVCSSCLTLLASPDSAGGGLGRARVVSQRSVLFSFFFLIIVPISRCLLVRIETHRSECKYGRNWVVKQVTLFPCEFQVDVKIPESPYFFVCHIFPHFGLAPFVVSQPNSSRT